MRKCNVCEEWFNSLDKHHIQSRSKGGSNKKQNIIQVCANCHRLIHIGEIVIEGKFPSTEQGGFTLIFRNKEEPSIMNLPLPEVYIIGS